MICGHCDREIEPSDNVVTISNKNGVLYYIHERCFDMVEQYADLRRH